MLRQAVVDGVITHNNPLASSPNCSSVRLFGGCRQSSSASTKRQRGTSARSKSTARTTERTGRSPHFIHDHGPPATWMQGKEGIGERRQLSKRVNRSADPGKLRRISPPQTTTTKRSSQTRGRRTHTRGRAAASHPALIRPSTRVEHAHFKEAQHTRGTRMQERTAFGNPADSSL